MLPNISKEFSAEDCVLTQLYASDRKAWSKKLSNTFWNFINH